MKTKPPISSSIVDTNPALFDLNILLPSNFLDLTELPPMLNRSQLALFGYVNLRRMLGSLQLILKDLESEIQAIQTETDNFDDLTPGCIHTMATNFGCTLKDPQPQFTTQTPLTCQFGPHIAKLCQNHCDSCQTCPSEKPPCVFADDTENHIDDYIGELIGQINRYENFIEQLTSYIHDIESVTSKFSSSTKINAKSNYPPLLRWRPKNYPRPGEKVIHFAAKYYGGFSKPDGIPLSASARKKAPLPTVFLI